MNQSVKQKEGLGPQSQQDQAFELFKTLMVILAFSIVPASFLLLPINERISNAKHLQFVSGVSPLLYWISNFTWDMINFMIPVLACMVIFLLAPVLPLIGDWTSALCTLTIFIFYGFAIIPTMYPFSILFDTPSLAFVSLSIGNFIIGMVTSITVVVLEQLANQEPSATDLKTISDILKQVFMIFPQYCLGRGLLDMVQRNFLAQFELTYTGQDTQPSVWDWEHTSSKLVAFTIQSVFFSFLLLAIEYRGVLRKLFGRSNLPTQNGQTNCCCIPKRGRRSPGEGLTLPAGEDGNSTDEDDVDVAKERLKIEKSDTNAMILIRGLTKDYGGCVCGGKKFRAVDRLSVGMKSGQCFGLLGVNGAGKTTTFKMLTGKTDISYGDAYFNGISVHKDIGRVQQMIGYCPQFDALNPLLTGREQLALYARLRGVAEKDVKKVVDWGIKYMHLTPHASQTTKNYSGGNKRKLSTAIALIGNPAVVLLDEPSAGMDPKARRFLWNRIIDVVKDGRCVVLTSHSMEECETLCNRIGIMVNGKLKCLGSVQHLKNRFGEGYTLTMKIKQTSAGSVDAAHEIVMGKFAGVELKSRHNGLLVYKLPSEGIQLPEIFGVLEETRSITQLEDYSLSQTTLDQVFISFANQQKLTPIPVVQVAQVDSDDSLPMSEKSFERDPQNGNLLADNSASNEPMRVKTDSVVNAGSETPIDEATHL